MRIGQRRPARLLNTRPNSSHNRRLNRESHRMARRFRGGIQYAHPLRASLQTDWNRWECFRGLTISMHPVAQNREWIHRRGRLTSFPTAARHLASKARLPNQKKWHAKQMLHHHQSESVATSTLPCRTSLICRTPPTFGQSKSRWLLKDLRRLSGRRESCPGFADTKFAEAIHWTVSQFAFTGLERQSTESWKPIAIR